MEASNSINSEGSSVSTTQPPTSSKASLHGGISLYIVALLFFIIGTCLGFILTKEFPQEKIPTQTSKELNTNLFVPNDAVQIDTCENNKGSLFVRPKDIPQGPIYMSYKGKIVGIEFMLDLNQIMKNNKFDFLYSQDVHVDHIKFGYVSEGHVGNPFPHFHADLYTVPRSVEEAIVCPPGQTKMNMPGMDMDSSSSASLTPQPSGMEMMISPTNSRLPMQLKKSF